MKDVIWLGNSLDRVRSFPASVREQIGRQLMATQLGHEPWDCKPMPSIGPGVKEIRARTAAGAWRVFYIAKLDDAVYVLHAFSKKTQKTPKQDLEIARKRLAGIKR